MPKPITGSHSFTWRTLRGFSSEAIANHVKDAQGERIEYQLPGESNNDTGYWIAIACAASFLVAFLFSL